MKSLFESTGLSALLLGSGSSVCDVVKPRAEDQALGSSMRSSWCLLPGERGLKARCAGGPCFSNSAEHLPSGKWAPFCCAELVGSSALL